MTVAASTATGLVAPAGPKLVLGGAAVARVLLAGVLALAAVVPSAYLLWVAAPILLDGGWLVHFASTTLPHQAWASLAVALEASAVAFAAGAVPAVAVSRFDFRLRGLVTVLALLPLLFAPYVTASTWMTYFSSAFFEGRHALAIELGLACGPYVFIVFRVAASRIPNAFSELAAALGCGPWQRLWRVHLPSHAVPAAASLMIVFAQSIGDYGAAERLGIDTLSVGIHNLWLASQNSWVAAIASTLLIVPALVLVAVAAWASTSIISQNPIPPAAAASSRKPLAGPAAWALVGWSMLCSLPGFWIPEAITVRWAWLRWERTRFAAIPGDMLNAALTSLSTALLVGAVCALTAVLMRAGSRSRLAERMPWLYLTNYFLPSLVLALAFVMMSRDGAVLAELLGPLRDTRLLIVLTEALRFMPFAILPTLDALRRTPPAMIEAARAFGAGPVRARMVAFSGHLWPALVLGCALVFMESLKELDMSLMLQPFGYTSPSLKIWAFARHQNMDRAAVWVLITQVLMLLPLALLVWRMERLGERRAG
ncbi:iron ABC transporter permease [Ideonella sp. A 288]|uniref:ABC transporter permease n=1 Tax=Ideonella sp. A 288 TaxID=1962181 RepID=UPI000B4A7046|nr:ABC transporter permease subunit [Ideonella sp. A 288]